MALGLQLPQYCEDLDYPAILDRYLINDLGIQGGVATNNSFKVVAGSGLQVEAFDGGAFVPGGEGGTTGMYHVSSLSTITPYNNVEIPTVNPQIAQIILRVYDVNELKISGSSFARIEWLNGTPNAGATKAHVEEGKASEFGAAALPVSSYRLCYIVVPKNATVSSEYSIVDARNSSMKWPLTSYGALVERAPTTEYTPSLTHRTEVIANVTLTIKEKQEITSALYAGGIRIAFPALRASGENVPLIISTVTVSFTVNAEEKWKWLKEGTGTASVFTSYKLL